MKAHAQTSLACLLGAIFLVGIMTGQMCYAAAAAATKPQGPINAEADRASFDLKAKAHHFQGRVRVTQGDFSVDADQAWVQGDAGRQVVRAIGSPVQVAWPTERIKANAQKVEYEQSTGELRLSGKVHLDQSGSSIDSEFIRYSLITRAAMAEGGTEAQTQTKGRVRMRWVPEETGSRQPQSEEPASSTQSITKP